MGLIMAADGQLLHYLVGAVSIALVYCAWRVTTNYFALQSLKVSGPLIAKLTSKWLFVHDTAGNNANCVQEIHKKYGGNVVQIAPRELSFSSATAIRDIYGPSSKCFKSKVYSAMGREAIFQIVDPERHRERQKKIMHMFSLNVLLQLKPMIQEQVSKMIDLVEKSIGKPCEVIYVTRMLALDISGLCFFPPSQDRRAFLTY